MSIVDKNELPFTNKNEFVIVKYCYLNTVVTLSYHRTGVNRDQCVFDEISPKCRISNFEIEKSGFFPSLLCIEIIPVDYFVNM